MGKKQPTTPSPEPKAPKKFLRFQELQSLCTQERECQIVVNGEPGVVMVRSLTPTEEFKIKALLQKALPPRIEPEGGEGEATLDMQNPEYLAAYAKYQQQGRALGIFLGCPLYRQEILRICGVEDVPNVMPTEGGPVTLERVTEIVQSQLTEDVVNRIWLAISQGGVSEEEYASFFSEPASARN